MVKTTVLQSQEEKVQVTVTDKDGDGKVVTYLEQSRQMTFINLNGERSGFGRASPRRNHSRWLVKKLVYIVSSQGRYDHLNNGGRKALRRLKAMFISGATKPNNFTKRQIDKAIRKSVAKITSVHAQ